VLENGIKIIGKFASDLGELYKIATCSKEIMSGTHAWNGWRKLMDGLLIPQQDNSVVCCTQQITT